MKILGLDLGTKTGWCIIDNGKYVESGVQVFDVRRGESPGMRYLRFRAWLTEILRTIEVVGYEAPHHRGGSATEVACGFSTRVQEICAEYGIEHMSVHTATLKKWATGNGRASKGDMITAALHFLDESTRDRVGSLDGEMTDDEADAIHVTRRTAEQAGTTT